MTKTHLLQLKQSGLTYQQIGDRLQVSKQRAHQLIDGQVKSEIGKCHDCGQRKRLERHHESYWPEKKVLLCHGCHRHRHTFWHLVNWDLPNWVIAKIWNRSGVRVSQVRKSLNKPQRYFFRRSIPAELAFLVSQQIEKSSM